MSAHTHAPSPIAPIVAMVQPEHLQDEVQRAMQQRFDVFSSFVTNKATELLSEGAWWRHAESLGNSLKLWIDRELANAAQIAGEKVDIDGFRACIADVASYDELAKVLETTFAQMRESFPPPEEAQGHEKRKDLVHRALEMAKERVVGVLRDRTSIDEDVLKRDVGAVCTAIEALVVLIGDLGEQHPALTEILILAGSMLLGAFISEWFILRPLLRLFGFGPLGPIKGTSAAWAQSYFWGPAVGKGSWFAALQRAGMVGIGQFGRAVGALVGGLIAARNI